MTKLEQLLKRCKCGVHLEVNVHRDYHEPIAGALEKIEDTRKHQDVPPLDSEIKAKMLELDTVIDLCFFPDTPIGSYQIYHYDIEAALDEALECLNEKN